MRHFVLIGFALSLARAAEGQVRGDAADREVVAALAQAVFHAAHVGDTATLGRLYAPDYLMILPDGKSQNRAERLTDVAKGGPHGAVSRLTADNIRLYDDLAVLFGRVEAWNIDTIAHPGMRHDGPPPSRPPDRWYRFIQIFVRSSSGWLVSMVQSVPVDVQRVPRQPR